MSSTPLRRVASAAITIVAVFVVGVGPAVANGSATLVANPDGTVTASLLTSGQRVFFCVAGQTQCARGAALFQSADAFNGVLAYGSAVETLAPVATTLPAGTYNLVVDYATGPSAVRSPLSNVVIAGPALPAAEETKPAPATLSLDLSGSDAVCTTGPMNGLTGEWMSLPGPADCALPGEASVRLLGWSTSSTFPLAIAQRQVDLGWGAYELTDDAGRVVAVFVPAGQATFISGPNTLHPIWSE